jgi:hydroxylamine reductase
VNVYTHGEMLPAHMYPNLRKHPHLAGHFGGAWQDQRREFGEFSGPIVATTNCVLIPPSTYRDRLYTTRVTAVPGGKRLEEGNFAPVIAAAQSSSPLPDHPVRTSTIGFHHKVLLGVADKIVGAVKAGKIKHFYLIGGCDGAALGRSYFTDAACATPEDSLILTLGCGKYRLRNEELGTIEIDGVGRVPRLLDMGQCNDAFGAIQVAVALAGAFGCSVNELPLTIVLSWFEQKAVAVLLTLLHLGVKGIRIGPSAPAFVSPNVLRVLVDRYDLRLTGSDARADLRLVS